MSLYKHISSHICCMLNNNFHNSKFENVICVYKSPVIRGKMVGDPLPFLFSRNDLNLSCFSKFNF